MKRVKEDDPRRCQAQKHCQYEAMEGSKYCAACGGTNELKSIEAKELKNYRLTQVRFRESLNRFTENDNLKSLREEIAILRMLMEERLNSIQSPIEILAHTHTISDLTLKIEKLVSSCDKIDKAMGNYLDKAALVQLGMEIVGIITNNISDLDTIDKISTELAELIERLLND